MIQFAKTTIQKEGTITEGDVTYSVSVATVNNELTRLYCGINKKTIVQHSDGNGGSTGVEENQSVGHIIVEYGRQAMETGQGENPIPYLTKFQEIYDEVTGKEAETKAKK